MNPLTLPALVVGAACALALAPSARTPARTLGQTPGLGPPGGGQAGSRAPRVRNTGLAVENNAPLLSGDVAIVAVSELRAGETDLNGDGDHFDEVLHVLDARTGQATSLGLAGRAWTLRNGVAGLLVSEFAQGTDLNGDGHVYGSVVHVHDLATGVTTNLGLVAQSVHASDALLVFGVEETWQGATDLNGDGDAIDTVAHVYDVATGTVVDLGLAQVFGAHVGGTTVSFLVPEWAQGNTDLNFDGDTDDTVVVVYEHATGTVYPIPAASVAPPTVHPDGDWLGFSFDEERNGGIDLNLDGDGLDEVLVLARLSTGTLFNTQLDARGSPSFTDGHAVFVAWEEGQGVDLNGDLDVEDRVLFTYDLAAGTLANVGLAVASPAVRLVGARVVFDVFEWTNGGGDLNGDGDAEDTVVAVHDPATMTTRMLGAGAPTGGSDRWLTLSLSEGGQGNTDLNGDGDAADSVAHVYDVATDTLINLELAGLAPAASYEGSLTLVFANELQEQTDLNGDGDTADRVVHAYDPLTERLVNLRIAMVNYAIGVPAEWLEERRAFFLVHELVHGATDLNGDGDLTDSILHVVDRLP